LRLGAQDHVLLRTMHHIVSDGWSEGVFNHELMVLYEAFVEGRENPLRPLRVQYADFALWQRRWLEGGALDRGLSYWKEQLAGIPARLELPADRPRPALQTFGGEICSMTVPAVQVAALKRLSQDHQSTLYMTLLAVFGMLLSRYSGQDDIVVGSPIANRQEEQLEALIGFFVNSLVMRVRLRSEMSFGELLSQVRQTALAAYEYQDVPFERLVEELSPERSLNATPLFQVVFAMQNVRMDKQQLKQLEVTPVGGGELRVRFDLEVHAFEHSGEITVHWLYNRDLFDRWRMEQMARHYVQMLEAVVRHPGPAVGRVEMLSAPERQQLLYEWNDTGTAFPNKCVHQLFEAQVEKTPKAIAVVCEDEELSYAQLNARANQLAHYLRKVGIRTGDTVAILMERSMHTVVAEIAVLKCGAAYVPIDPAYAEERKAFLISDCGARAVLVSGETVLPAGLSTARVDLDSVILDEEAATDLATPLDGEALAYVMYTSGSTGQPKGVMVPHRGITRLIWNNNYARFSQQDRMAFAVNPSFDVSTLEVWAPLLNGGCVVVIRQETLLDPTGFGQVLEEQAVNVLWLTVCLFNQYAHILHEQFAGLRYLMTGGDVLDPAVMARVLSRHAPQHLLNGYGPTETTTFATTYEIAAVREDGSSIPIGRPISNTQVYILDAQGEPVPVGVVGELYIGGAGVAWGYLNRPELTGEKFVPDPYSVEAGARMYRTGDSARWRQDGKIEFIGRNDNQVKIRGFRIELGEIEAALRGQAGVGQAVVVAREDLPGRKQLVGYVVGRGGEEIDGVAVRRGVGERLPEYMVPAAIVVLKELPLNANGKLERKALPAPEFVSTVGRRGPRSPEEEILAGLFAEVLQLEGVGIDDDFFDLGGHSLLATRLISRIRATLGIELGIRSLFESPTVASLGQRVGVAERGRTRLRAGVRPERVPLSFAQKRLWFLQQMEGAGGAYNLPVGLRLEGKMNRKALREALGDVVERHEILRTVFWEDKEGPWQKVLEVGEIPEFIEEKEIGEEEVEGELKEAGGYRFDLQREIPLKVWVLKVKEEEHVLLLLLHHIATDGWSMAPLGRDLAGAYNARSQGEAPSWRPLPVQYADYSLWQAEWLGEEKDGESSLSRQLQYWKENLAGIAPEMELPRDRVRPGVSSYRGEDEKFELSGRLHEGLLELARKQGATLFMVLQAGLAVLLTRLGGGRDIVLGSPVAGRTDDALDDLVGFFVNTLVLRTDTSGRPSFEELLRRVRESDLNAYAHQDLPFEYLVEVLNPERSLNRHPLFQVMLVLQNTARAELEMKGLKARGESRVGKQAKFDLTLSVREERGGGGKGEGLQCQINYAVDLYERRTIQKLAERLKRVLQAVVDDPGQRIGEIEILEEEERRQIVEEWNETAAAYAEDKCIHELFEKQVELTPDAIAVIYEDAYLSYRQLNQRSNHLAYKLRGVGVRAESVVGICLERGLSILVGVLGILKAGGAYLPLDPDSPKSRLAETLEDAQASVVVTEERLLGQVTESVHRVCLDGDWTQELEQEYRNPEVGLTPENLVYVIYTSGSTGKPKSIMIPHGNLTGYARWANGLMFDSTVKVVPAVQALSFDGSLKQFFAPLLSGLAIWVLGKEVVSDPVMLIKALERGRNLRFSAVPSLWTAMLDVLESGEAEMLPDTISRAFVGGEELAGKVAERSFKAVPGLGLWNFYGPTEITATAATTQIKPGEAV